MKTIIIKAGLIVLFLSYSIYAFPQCNILNKVSPDGSMQYYMEPVNFYWTKAKSLKGCIVTDKENYFLELHPVPFPEKSESKKLKEDLHLELADGNSCKLSHYDTRFTENDTVMEMLFLIEKSDIDKLFNSEVNQAILDMKGEEGVRTYSFKLHKNALKEQLSCFLDEEKNKDKMK